VKRELRLPPSRQRKIKDATHFIMVETLSGDGEKEYIQMVKETAKATWGPEAAERLGEHIERTAAAVYAVSNYPLEPGVEPVTRMRPGET